MTIEDLAKNLSLKLADKLEKKEITIEEMAKTIDKFLILSGRGEDAKELKDFVENI